MTLFQRGMARAATIVVAILFWVWLATKGAVTLIGATTVADDYNQFIERLPAISQWLFSTPWWVPAILASLLTGFLVWLSWPATTPSKSDINGVGGISKKLPEPTKKIENKTFVNCEVEIDDNRFLSCKFKNVKLIYNGTTKIEFVGCEFYGSNRVTSKNPGISSMIHLLFEFGLYNGPFYDEGDKPLQRNTTNIL
jgi:hypothetical protein